MDINVSIICITVVIVAAFAAGSVAYVANRRHKLWEAAVAFAAALVVQAGGEVSGDE